MTFETKQEVTIVKGDQKELEEYKAKHGLTKGEGVCVIAEEQPLMLKADTPADGYYKEKIASQAKRIRELEEELREAQKNAVTAIRDLHQAEQRMHKLEAALIEASIK